MKRSWTIGTYTRRDFLSLFAVLPALTCISRVRLQAADATRLAPYLDLQPFIEPGADEFRGEKLAFDQQRALSEAFLSKRLPIASGAAGFSPCPATYKALAADLAEAVFDRADRDVAAGWGKWIDSLGAVRRFQFFVLPDETVRYEVASQRLEVLEYRVGFWRISWSNGRITEFSPVREQLASSSQPWFRDVTKQMLGQLPVFRDQLRRGIPYWRSRLDPATGIDIYGSNGIAVGDIDNDGADEVYICQPGGLPNRLLKFDVAGRASDLSATWGVDLLDDTSCALFLDLRNSGHQDLIVLRSTGPVLFLNEGGRFQLRADAFQFAQPAKGGFTGMAAADFDRDGKLDLYLCCYVYFQSEAQYTYAVPYHDARNGPPNFLFRNRLAADGTGHFEDCTAETGIDHNNDRFSFAPAWCDYNGDGWPDLYVANDFGKKNLYKNTNGRFHDVAADAGVEDIGPGMSAAWFDYDRDGKPDLYVANMWTDAGQRVVADPEFKPASKFPDAYRAHTMGNSLFRNRGEGTFEDVTARENVGFGRWAWSSGGHDFDNDGIPEILITCGMLTNESPADLNSFFWRQVVAKSPLEQTRSTAYENGWNAINQFVREKYSWSGHEPNVFHVRRGNRYFDFSGISGLDWAEDSRAFAVLDFDGDGRPDIILKSRLGPQVRTLQNNCAGKNRSIAFRLQGTKSNRDAIGAKIELDGQTKWLEAGTGFLSQHTKRISFGLGSALTARVAKITWPSGLVQKFSNLKTRHTYSIQEGSDKCASEPFREHQQWTSEQVIGDNTLRLADTWFAEPLPLPAAQPGPGLFVIKERSREYEIYRRYLFDWRTDLSPPLPLLLNRSGEVVKVYGALPSKEQVHADRLKLDSYSPSLALPFPGFFLKPPKRDFFKFGAAYLWAGFPEQALAYLLRVLEQDPNNTRVLVLVGQIHLEGDRLSEAARFFVRAAELDPSSAQAHIGLGDVAARKSDLPEAASQYRKAFELDPQSAEAANGVGLASAKLGQFDAAQRYFETAITLRRSYPEAINNLAVMFSKQGKIKDAVAAWSYGIQVAPDEDILYLNLGRTYVQLGDNEKARAVMQQLLDRKPDDVTAKRALEQLGAAR